MEKPSALELQAGTDAPSPDKKPTLAQVSQGSAKSPNSMNAFELDSHLRDRATHHAREIAKDIPYLREMRDLLSAQGQRTDLKKANPRLIGKDGRKWELGWLFDFVRHFFIDNPGVPQWWPGFCLASDIVFGAWVAVLIITRRQPPINRSIA